MGVGVFVQKGSAIGGGTTLAVWGTLNISESPLDWFKLPSNSCLEYHACVAN
jgi:hypothetical protein